MKPFSEVSMFLTVFDLTVKIKPIKFFTRPKNNRCIMTGAWPSVKIYLSNIKGLVSVDNLKIYPCQNFAQYTNINQLCTCKRKMHTVTHHVSSIALLTIIISQLYNVICCPSNKFKLTGKRQVKLLKCVTIIC